MHPTRSVQIHQQRRVRNHAGSNDSYEFFNMLTSSELLDQVEDLLPDHRERLYPPTETLSMFLAQALSTDRSCQRAVACLGSPGNSPQPRYGRFSPIGINRTKKSWEASGAR